MKESLCDSDKHIFLVTLKAKKSEGLCRNKYRCPDEEIPWEAPTGVSN